jgi:PAS domain S-box-containing protein
MVTGWSIPPLLLASITAFVATHYFVIYLRTRRSREPLTFAHLALFVAVYDISCALVDNASSAAVARPWQIFQYGAMTVGGIALMAFVADYTRQRLGRPFAGVCAAYGLLWLVVLVGGTRLLVTSTPAVKHVTLPFGARATYMEMAAGPLASVHGFIALGVFAYVFWAGAAHYRAGEKGRALRLLAATGVLFLAAVNDALVSFGVIRSPYLIEYAFLGVVILMADSLSKELVHAAKVQEALERSERNYHDVFDSTNDAIFVHDAGSGAILDVNRAFSELYGWRREEALGLAVADLSANRPPFTEAIALAHMRRAIEEGPQILEWLARRRDGEEFWVEVSLRASLIGSQTRVLAVVRDIGERKRAADALARSEDRFRSMVQQSYDYLTVLDASGTITYATPSACSALGYDRDGLIGRDAFQLVHPDDRELVLEAFQRAGWGTPTGKPIEFRFCKADGSCLFVEALGSNQLENPAIGGILVNARDVTERHLAEESTARTLRELRVLNAVAQAAVTAEDEDSLIARVTAVVREALYPDDCGVMLLDDATTELRYTSSYVADPGVGERKRESIPVGHGITGVVAQTGTSMRLDDITADARYIARTPEMRSELCVPLKLGSCVIGVFNVESRVPGAFCESDERVLSTICGQLATAIGRLRAAAAHREVQERSRRLAESAFEGIGIHDNGTIVDANSRLAEMLGYEVTELIGRHVMDFVAPASAEEVDGYLRIGRDDVYEHLAVRKDGTIFPIETQGKPLPGGGGALRVAAVRDITEHKRAEERINRQFARLAALRAIDATITEGKELSSTMEVVLDAVLSQLRVDAALIMRLDREAHCLVTTAGRGLALAAAPPGTVCAGDGVAGRAVATGGLVAVRDLATEGGLTPAEKRLADDGFRAAFAAALVAKGKAHGVLEVFHATAEQPDAEWIGYLETLAGQLAIAIDNRLLFESLERSNAELARAYDTTLEGWSRALELRDRETQGHCARVVETTLTVARAMGIGEDELVNLRRGVLLHDIGKMAIPDSILFKSGPLTTEEWTVMKRHPQFAYDLLEPIEFLRPALEIPLCHHEWWDGSGYPRGLKGEEIPLAARIFSVVDSWDGLSYPRPYREAWCRDRVSTFVASEAGTHFDPRVVDVFFGVVS